MDKQPEVSIHYDLLCTKLEEKVGSMFQVQRERELADASVNQELQLEKPEKALHVEKAKSYRLQVFNDKLQSEISSLNEILKENNEELHYERN